jgi:hypothetical protein
MDVGVFDGLEPVTPFYGQPEFEVIIGPIVEVVECRTIQAYLPGLMRYASTNYNGIINMNHHMRRFQSVRRHYVAPRFMRRAILTLMRSIARNTGPSESTNIDLISFLERTTHHPRRFGNQMYFGTTYQLFAAFAELSEYCHSTRIANVLQQFFSKYGAQIAESEDSYALFEWARAILDSGMSEAAMLLCFREILTVRPDFEEDMREVIYHLGTTEAMIIWRSLRALLRNMDDRDFEPVERGRGLLRRGRGYGMVRHRYARSFSPYHVRRSMMTRPGLPRSFHSHSGSFSVHDSDVVPRRLSRGLNLVNQKLADITIRQHAIEDAVSEANFKAEAALQSRPGSNAGLLGYGLADAAFPGLSDTASMNEFDDWRWTVWN